MKAIKASYTVLTEIDERKMLKRIEEAGRTCYQSSHKISDESYKNFVRMIIANGHESVMEHEVISVRFIVDRGVSHELVRHRIASFSQESTRYCNYGKKDIEFIEPCFWYEADLRREAWEEAMKGAEEYYKRLLDLGAQPQEARSVLPNSLKTDIVITANLREWRTIFKQRASGKAHPQMREVMIPLLKELQAKLPEVFSDIPYYKGE